MNPALDWLSRLGKRRPDEQAVKELLTRYEIATPRGRRIDDGQSENATADLTPPLVVKLCSPDVLHKSERGGVVLDVGPDDLAKVMATMRVRFPGQPLLVEEQLERRGPEMIVGAMMDPEFGPAVMVGAGGIMTELLDDVGFRLAPCPHDEARRMLEELRIAPLFAGYRGLLAAGVKEALADTIARVADLAVDLGPALGQLDLNPLAAVDTTWTVLDASLVLGAKE